MALITCPECGKEYSDQANACPNCACPSPRTINGNSYNRESVPPKVKKKPPIIQTIIVFALVAAGAWYAYINWSYRDGLNAMYSGNYSIARKRLESLNYDDSEWALNDISFLEDLETIVRDEISRGDDYTNIVEEASQTLEKIRKYQAVEFHTEGLNVAVEQYADGLKRIASAYDYESANATQFEILAGKYYCDQIIVQLHDKIGFMQNSTVYDNAYTGILAEEEAYLTALNDLSENGHVETKAGDFWYNTVKLYLQNDTDYSFSQTYIFNFCQYNTDVLLDTVTTDVVEIEPHTEYIVSIDVPQSARGGYSVNYSYYITAINGLD